MRTIIGGRSFRRATGLLGVLLFLAGCPADPGADPSAKVPTAKVTIVTPGTGEPNAAPLWPLAVGYQARFDAATWFIARDHDVGGQRMFVMQSAVSTPHAIPDVVGAIPNEDAETEAWLGETKDGVVLYATSAARRLPYGELIVPATVRDGMHWRVEGGGKVLAEGVVTGGATEDTIFGKRRTWMIVVTPAVAEDGSTDGRAVNATFAEGRGIIAVNDATGVDADGAPLPPLATPVIAATVPDGPGPAPAPLARTPLVPMNGGAPVAGSEGVPHSFRCRGTFEMPGVGIDNVDGGPGLRMIDGSDVFSRAGFGGSYLSAVEGADGDFRVRLGGYTARCIVVNGNLALWVPFPLVYSATTDGQSVTLDGGPNTSYGYLPDAAQDARTAVWRRDGGALAFHPVQAAGQRMAGLFWVALPDPFNPAPPPVFAHSSVAALLDVAGTPLSMGLAGGLGALNPDFFLPPNGANWWYWPQQPTASSAPTYLPKEMLPVGDDPIALAGGDFFEGARWSPYLSNDHGELFSGHVEYLPEAAPFERVAYTEVRTGALTGDAWTTALHTDNTRETLLAGSGGIYRVAHTGYQGLGLTLVARPELPDGHRVTGAFIAGDQVVVATEAGRMHLAEQYDPAVIYSGRAYLWHLPALPELMGASATAEPLPAQASATRTGRDLRICVPEGRERPPLTGWSLGSTPGAPAIGIDAGDRCVVLIRSVESVSDSDALIGHGPIPGLGLVTLAAGPTAELSLHLVSDDAPPDNDAFPQGWIPDRAGAGAWRLVPTAATDPATCPTGPCERLSWRPRRGTPIERLVAGVTETPILLAGGGLLVIAGDTVRVHPPGQLEPTITRAVPAPPTGDLPADATPVNTEVWLPAATLDATWRCTVTGRDYGDPLAATSLESIACRRGDGVVAAPAMTDRCGRGLIASAQDRVQPDGLVRLVTSNAPWDDNAIAIGARPDQAEVLWDPGTGACAVRPIVLQGAAHMDPTSFVTIVEPVVLDSSAAVAPDGARFVVEATRQEGAEEARSWRIYQLQARHAGRELLAEGVGSEVGYTLVAGRDSVALWGAPDFTHEGTPIPARVLRHVARVVPPSCACGLGAICARGVCACPDGTSGDPTRAPADGGCLAAPGSAAAPAPSCAALASGPNPPSGPERIVWVDPDGLGGPFLTQPVTCDGALTHPLQPRISLGGGNEIDVYGAFEIKDFSVQGLLVLDGPERSPEGNGVGYWSPIECSLDSTDGQLRSIADCAAPGHIAVTHSRENHENGFFVTLSDGLAVVEIQVEVANPWWETRLTLSRDDVGTLRLSQGGKVLYERATGKLPPMRVVGAPAAVGGEGGIGWYGADCAHATDPWPSAPALCTCTPLACAERASVCGPVDDGCDRVQDCGVCASGYDCADNACLCAPDATEATPAGSTTLAFGTPLPATFHAASDVDVFNASTFVDKPGNASFALFLEGPAAGTTEVVLTVHAVPDGGNGCTITCTTGTQGTDPSSGYATCTASVPAAHAPGTPVAAADVNCAGFQNGVGLVVTARPTTWDAACMPYALTLTRTP